MRELMLHEALAKRVDEHRHKKALSNGPKGKFVVFEGGEGVGKGTQQGRLAARLRRVGLEVVETREPGGTPFAEDCRKMFLNHRDLSQGTEMLLLLAARRDHVERVIYPALQRGAWVIGDRFMDSSYVYQNQYPGGVSIEMQHPAHLTWLPGGAWPDWTFVLDLDVEIGLLRRRHAGNTNRIDEKPMTYHERIRNAYRHIGQSMANHDIIDASAPPDRVEAAILLRLIHRFPELKPLKLHELDGVEE